MTILFCYAKDHDIEAFLDTRPGYKATIRSRLSTWFRGAGWNVIKVIWGSDWDDFFASDKSGLLLKRMDECVDGDFQKYSVEPGSYTRKHFFGKYPELLSLVNHMTDEQIHKLLRGGHDPRKVYAAYQAAATRLRLRLMGGTQPLPILFKSAIVCACKYKVCFCALTLMAGRPFISLPILYAINSLSTDFLAFFTVNRLHF